MLLRSSVAIVGSGLVVLACGGTPPAKPVATGGDAGLPEGAGSTTHPDDAADGGAASDAGAGAGAAGTSGAASTGSAASATPPSPPEPKDECTPVGVDFEKRARPKLKECYAEGKKKNPNLEGTVKLTVEIDGLGKIKVIKIVEKTLPEPVAQCMLKVLKATPLTEAAKCPGKSLTIPVTFPTPH